MSHHVIMFQPRFAPLVESGKKLTTIRGARKRAIKAGDTLSLREWTGKPYRSKQRELRTAVVTAVDKIEMLEGGMFPWSFTVYQNGYELNCAARILFSSVDGFSGVNDMARWFKDTHGLPFTGVRISWS